MSGSSSIIPTFTLNQLAKIPLVSEPRFSPSGQHLVCVSTINEGDVSQNELMLIDCDTNEQEFIAEGYGPQFSPDGKYLAFVKEGEDRLAIQVFELTGRSILHTIPFAHSDFFVDHYTKYDFQWSADSQTIAFLNIPIIEQFRSSVRSFSHLLYKTKGGRGRSTYSDSSPMQIWLYSLSSKMSRQVTDFDEHPHSISWSPDANRISFVRSTAVQPGASQSSAIFVFDMANGAVNKLTNDIASVFQPAWSPAGDSIIFLGINALTGTNDSPYEDTQLYIVPATGGPAVQLTAALNRRIEQIRWDDRGEQIYFTAGDKGSVALYTVRPESKTIEPVINMRGKILDYDVSVKRDRIACVYSDTLTPPTILLQDQRSSSRQIIRSPKQSAAMKLVFQDAVDFWFSGADNLEVQGWLIKPANFQIEMKYPLVLVIHGGPHNMFGFEFEDRMQWLAANGFGVLFINPRGSSGYGQAFSSGTMNGWGEGDYHDLMKGLDYAIARNNWIDPDRLCVTGQSYGGYMTNRIITKTNRFRAAVVDGGISNLISFAGTSLYHSLMESEFGGSVYDNFSRLWQCSPLKDVKEVKTPTLFLHGATDNEVPFSQAEEMFIAVKKMGVDTELIQYVDEGHGWRPDLLPSNRKDILQRMLDWFQKYIS